MINVSVVTYQTPLDDVNHVLEECNKSGVVKNIYVVDNSPADYLRDMIIGFSKVVYLHNPRNPGYGAGHNLAMAQSLTGDVDYHLVINADVIFESAMLEGMLCFCSANPDVSLLAPKMFYEDGSIQFNCKLLPTPLNMFLRAFLPKGMRTSIDTAYQLENMDHNKPIQAPYVSGAFMFLKCATLKEVGMFDERYFMYPEDIDLSRRVSAVAVVLFAPQFQVIHKYGGATRKSIRMFLIHISNMCKYFNKWGWLFDDQRNLMNFRTINQPDFIVNVDQA